MSVEDSEKLSNAAEIASATIATGAGIAIGGTAGALVGAATAPVLTHALLALSTRVQSVRHERTIEVLTEVARLLHIDEADLPHVLASDERLLELTSRIILAAQDTSNATKRSALSRALATAAADPAPARLDICGLLQSAIAEIDAPHVRFMYVIEDAENLPAILDLALDSQRYGLSLQQVFGRDPGLQEGGPGILQKLHSLGLVESCARGISTTADRDKPYALSDLGRRLLQLLREDGELS
ncbi:hypothetical protein ACFWA1_19495 [Streptomyces sp. NPDC060005]|uniref:hypothetical protein n=1 Tax=Streptomyces sp. NPDC060005 TaxID=3347034 RepID=UPI0036C8BA11